MAFDLLLISIARGSYMKRIILYTIVLLQLFTLSALASSCLEVNDCKPNKVCQSFKCVKVIPVSKSKLELMSKEEFLHEEDKLIIIDTVSSSFLK